MQNKDGVPWYKAPLPPRFHRCRVHSSGSPNGEFIGRCACGATYIAGGWINKNETRKHRKRYGK